MTEQDHVPLGWLCPRCGRVWAPDVRSCDCLPDAPPQPPAEIVVYPDGLDVTWVGTPLQPPVIWSGT